MSVSGKKVVIWFYGAMGVLALAGLGITLWIRSQPVLEREQRSMSRLLANAYQKYRIDTKTWPTSPYEAAINFKSENEDLSKNVKKGEAEWGMTTTLQGLDSDSPELVVRFTKPSKMEQVYALRKSK